MYWNFEASGLCIKISYALSKKVNKSAIDRIVINVPVKKYFKYTGNVAKIQL